MSKGTLSRIVSSALASIVVASLVTLFLPLKYYDFDRWLYRSIVTGSHRMDDRMLLVTVEGWSDGRSESSDRQAAQLQKMIQRLNEFGAEAIGVFLPTPDSDAFMPLPSESYRVVRLWAECDAAYVALRSVSATSGLLPRTKLGDSDDSIEFLPELCRGHYALSFPFAMALHLAGFEYRVYGEHWPVAAWVGNDPVPNLPPVEADRLGRAAMPVMFAGDASAFAQLPDVDLLADPMNRSLQSLIAGKLVIIAMTRMVPGNTRLVALPEGKRQVAPVVVVLNALNTILQRQWYSVVPMAGQAILAWVSMLVTMTCSARFGNAGPTIWVLLLGCVLTVGASALLAYGNVQINVTPAIASAILSSTVRSALLLNRGPRL
jgi:CHASE2 domain-containing sensor protein